MFFSVATTQRQLARSLRPHVRSFTSSGNINTGGGSFAKKGKAQEEKYFKDLSAEQLAKFSEKLHQNEVAGLMKVLPANHNLDSHAIHDLLVWKHAPEE